MKMPLVKPNDFGIRPAGSPTACFYCKQVVGTPHKETCVCLTKTITLNYSISVTVEVPYSWTRQQIEFQRNEGGWCANNIIHELRSMKQEHGCLCCFVKTEYIKTEKPGPHITNND